MKFKITVKKKTKWYWTLQSADNNFVLATSEVYSSRNKAEQTAVKVFWSLDSCVLDEETFKRNVGGWKENAGKCNKSKPRRIKCECQRPE